MVELTVENNHLIVEVQGLHKLWALKRRLEVPLDCVRNVGRDPEALREAWKWVRWPGTYVPGLIMAGSYRRGGRWIFVDVRLRNREKLLVVDLAHHAYDQLIVEVADPDAASRLVQKARRVDGD